MQLPSDFESLMTEQLGADEYTKLASAIDSPSPTSIRINKRKTSTEEQASIQGDEPVQWCNEGSYIKERPQFTFDPLLHAGCYYVQEASSMYLSHILRRYVKEPVTALDLCAAPGGKSTLALATLPEGSLLIANEVVRQRANILAENIIKWGNPSCIVTNNYAEDFLPLGNIFDVVICDAPCSGEGMFRKDADSISEWSIANVNTCWQRQRDIVSNIWHTIKTGGLLIYSTCTYNHYEDEDNVNWIAKELGAEILSSYPDPLWKLDDKHTHFFPHKTKGEGFFVAVLKKTADDDTSFQSHKSKKKQKQDKGGKKQAIKIPKEISSWISDNETYTIYEEDGIFKAFPTSHYELLQQARQHVKVIHSGISLAITKGKALQPSHSLALSQSINIKAFPSVNLTYEQSIAYLRTEAITLPTDTPLGYILVKFQDHPLGFVKNVGNRANNLYPSEWKIKSTHVPPKNQKITQ